MLLALSAAAVPIIIYCRIRAVRYDAVAELLAVQRQERQLAPEIVECLTKNFALFAGDKGHIVAAATDKVDTLAISDSDKVLIKLAIQRINGEWVVDKNPWIFAFHRFYQCTRVGHIIGLHKEEQPTNGAVAYSAGTVFEVEIEDWGISLADLETYVQRVNDRKVVSKELRVNRCFPEVPLSFSNAHERCEHD